MSNKIMNKYINANKLRDKIDSFMDNLWKVLPDCSNVENGELSIREAGDLGAYKALESVICMIDTLQREQSETSNNLVDVDAVREDFMREVYRVLDADPTNDRANAIIDAFDSLPTVSQEHPEVDKYDRPTTPIEEAVEVTSRMQHIDKEMKPIAKFIMDYASWNLHKDEWNQPVIEVPLFRVLDALVQRGKPYCDAG